MAIGAVMAENERWVEQGLDPFIIDGDIFTVENTIDKDHKLIHDRTNQLHRWFEDLQGVSGKMSPYYIKASEEVKWWIRQLNLLCHEYECAVLAENRRLTAPEWTQCNQLFCFLNAPRFTLDPETDFELFGMEAIPKEFGGVYIGLNKAIGKHHFEAWRDEGGKDVKDLVTTAMRGQTEASGEFDISWAKSRVGADFIIEEIAEFKKWLLANDLDPNDKRLTIGHPKIGQVNLDKSFGTRNVNEIQYILSLFQDVCSIHTGDVSAQMDYRWSDEDYMEQQLMHLRPGYAYISREQQ